MTAAEPPLALAVDMVRCDGHGICAWVFPERIALDEWGYPRVDPQPITGRAGRRRARRAERACPRRALSLNPAPQPVERLTVQS